jgi:hypothetical protein
MDKDLLFIRVSLSLLTYSEIPCTYPNFQDSYFDIFLVIHLTVIARDFSCWWESILSSCWVYSVSNGKEHQKQELYCFWGVEHLQCMGLTSLPPSVSRRQFLCERSPWCQRKWWSCSCLCSLPVPVCPKLSMPVKHLCRAQSFLSERLSNHCQDLHQWIRLAHNRDKQSSCDYGNEPLGCMKCWETIKWLHNWWLLD